MNEIIQFLYVIYFAKRLEIEKKNIVTSNDFLFSCWNFMCALALHVCMYILLNEYLHENFHMQILDAS